MYLEVRIISFCGWHFFGDINTFNLTQSILSSARPTGMSRIRRHSRSQESRVAKLRLVRIVIRHWTTKKRNSPWWWGITTTRSAESTSGHPPLPYVHRWLSAGHSQELDGPDTPNDPNVLTLTVQNMVLVSYSTFFFYEVQSQVPVSNNRFKRN